MFHLEFTGSVLEHGSMLLESGFIIHLANDASCFLKMQEQQKLQIWIDLRWASL